MLRENLNKNIQKNRITIIINKAASLDKAKRRVALFQY